MPKIDSELPEQSQFIETVQVFIYGIIENKCFK